MGLRAWFNRVVLGKEAVTVRARGAAGKFKADDPATKDTNEAYTTVYKPKKKPAAKKKVVPIKKPAAKKKVAKKKTKAKKKGRKKGRK